MEEKNLIERLYEVIKERKTDPFEGSYTCYLFEKGIDKILKKVGEETTEVIIGCKNNDKEETLQEICDLTYHILVMMVEMGIEPKEVIDELEKRRQKICNKKPERKTTHGIH
ncbi:MAG: phosphoribosyl-ATP diphosphatase [Clostridiaceae bacterium]